MEFKDMTFEQFVDWAVGFFVINISHMPVKSIIWGILNNFSLHWIPSHNGVRK